MRLRALVGGFDFDRNKFNHATQAERQPGSAFKPFIYSAALEKGFSPATVVNDAPFFVPAERAGGEEWEPKNYDGRFEGPMRLRTALAKSKNLVTVRVLQAIGPQYAQDYIAKFGFDPKAHPAVLSMGLGSGAATPMQMATAFSVFANGGYRVSPYLIARITDARGTVLSAAQPQKAGGEAERVIDARNAFVMTSMLRDVVAYGTATKALSLGRRDIAGKTGTTNENVDAWFAGFTPQLVGVAWVGHDQPKSLGANETGAAAALPIWIAFMQKALKGLPDVPAEPPEGLVSLRINAESGLRDEAGTISEWFFNEYVPRRDGSAYSDAGARRTFVPGRPQPAVLVMGRHPRGDRDDDPTRGNDRRVERDDSFVGDSHERAGVAQVAARLIAEHGIGDWSLAKRKAARQLGLPGARGAAGRRRGRGGAARLPRDLRRRGASGDAAREARGGAAVDAPARRLPPGAGRRRRRRLGHRAQRRAHRPRHRRRQGGRTAAHQPGLRVPSRALASRRRSDGAVDRHPAHRRPAARAHAPGSAAGAASQPARAGGRAARRRGRGGAARGRRRSTT